MTLRKIAAVLAALSVGAVLAGCGAASNDAGARPVSAGEGVTKYPLTVENCGKKVTYGATPRRVVTMNQAAAEILIHLGVGGRIVGTGYEIDQIPPEIAGEYQKIPKLSAHGQEIKHEALLQAQPDFAYASFASFFTPAQSGERDVLHGLGVPTYLTEFDCVYHQSVAGARFELLFDEYRNLARIFDVPAAGNKLIAEQQAVINSGLETAKGIKAAKDPLTVMWFYSTFGGKPWAAGTGGLPQHVSEMVGVKNVFDDASTKWPEVSWDSVAARDPDVIVIADLTRGEPGDTAKEKIDLLKKDPLTSKLEAVANDRFVIIPGRYMDPSYGSAYAVPALAKGLVELVQRGLR
ncbi:iron complex transport system substrate-binding protein [Herbihabitans rhizosphaerae]|uniref:Iron complex transport system substrate-binding protein n=1 Tax=Herbihabitans rhizosphaerae TaxID=1872711 RepID=A0A4Q7KHC5_9PSEU|nr:ABC transporter substrate-binding protein [Herbihabitans rhizosphaerae]RZS32258.1 iron complex transport system substrate-binding protein [Herbihabitans rhizosphaerae]